MPARSLHGFLNPSEPKTKRFWILAPLIGSLIFIVLYVISAMLYPGGSHADAHSKGFSWMHNYWCNLLNEPAMNGEMNKGRPVAIAAMIVLALTLLSFWLLYPKLMQFKSTSRMIVWLSAFLSVISISFLSGPLHDISINISGFFGLIAMAGAYIGIYKNRWYMLFAFGILNLLLIAANNYMYHSGNGMYYLPVIQKIAFLSCLLWMCIITVKLYNIRVYDRA